MVKRRTVEECLANVGAYSDTDELAGWLEHEAAKHKDVGGMRYWLMEIQTHILGQYDLIQDMAYHLKKGNAANAKGKAHAVDE